LDQFSAKISAIEGHLMGHQE